MFRKGSRHVAWAAQGKRAEGASRVGGKKGPVLDRLPWRRSEAVAAERGNNRWQTGVERRGLHGKRHPTAL